MTGLGDRRRSHTVRPQAVQVKALATLRQLDVGAVVDGDDDVEGLALNLLEADLLDNWNFSSGFKNLKFKFDKDILEASAFVVAADGTPSQPSAVGSAIELCTPACDTIRSLDYYREQKDWSQEAMAKDGTDWSKDFSLDNAEIPFSASTALL